MYKLWAVGRGRSEGRGASFEEGAAHSHDFFGNTSTKFDSTYTSMIAAPTTCSRPEDGPDRELERRGAHIQPRRLLLPGGKDHTKVKSFAADLRIINDSRIRWYCGSGDEKAGSPAPPTRCKSGVLGLRIVFPDCVARASSGGQQLDSADHRSHMVRSVTRSDGTRRCPSTHPIPVPRLTINANYPIPTTPGTVTLSSDHQGDSPGSTMHADLWNTRDQAELKRLVTRCINNVPPSEPRPEECRAPTATA